MPVIPEFEVSQDDEFIILKISVPHVRIADLEYTVIDNSFSFYLKPFLLKLFFSNNLVDDERVSAVYDPNEKNGTVLIKLPKEEPGLFFEDLDLLTKLKQPPKQKKAKGSLIEVLKTEETVQDSDSNYNACLSKYCNLEVRKVNLCHDFGSEDCYSKEFLELEDIIEGKRNILETGKSVVAGLEASQLTEQTTYGFNNAYTNFFAPFRQEFPDLIDLIEPDEVSEELRPVYKCAQEDADFDNSRFLEDFFQGEEDLIFQESYKFIPHWESINHASIIFNGIFKLVMSNRLPIQFKGTEKRKLLELPNKEFLEFTLEETESALCAIFDVILGYVYDCRITTGEPTVESAWTIRKLSSTLSWLEVFDTPRTVMQAFAHRVLAYPYLRRLDLAEKSIEDGTKVFEGGKRLILRCLLKVHNIFAHSESLYLLNKLYITDMCVWIQKISEETVDSFSKKIKFHSKEMNLPDLIRWNLEGIIEESLNEVRDS